MWSIEMNMLVLLRGTDTQAKVIGIAEYAQGETMYLVEYLGDLGSKTSQWRSLSDLEPMPSA